MTPRERFRAALNFQPFDRLPIIEWASWWRDETIARWEREGLPPGLDNQQLFQFFGMDVHYQDWIRPRTTTCPQPASHGAPLIANADDYERLRPHLYPFPNHADGRPVVDPEKWGRWAQEQAAGNAVIWITLEGFFWFPRTLFGIEPHLFAFYDQPDLMRRMNADLAEHHLQIIDEVCRYATPDFMTFAEDLSYNHGPMLSQELFDTFLLPYYRRVVPVLKKKGITVIVDSDGDVGPAADWFVNAGIEGILPLERQAGVDVAGIRQKHPKMRFIGAFDKMTMFRGEAAMRAEFERLLPTARQGGFIISCDHQTPPQVSLEEYHVYLKLFKEYAAKAGSESVIGNQ